MPAAIEAIYRDALAEPNGIVLVTGPTGSGKTTTLYAGLRQLNDGTRNILTVEDPVEYAVDGVGQTQVNPKVGLTFAAGLRAILRQDPDVVMVGEIRDRETADIAVQASLTGHLVLSTVHTNDAVGAITRMRDMKVEPFLLASTAARGDRAAAGAPALPRMPQGRSRRASAVAALLGVDAGRRSSTSRRAAPPAARAATRAAIGVFEAVRIDDKIRALINAGGDEAAIGKHAFRKAATLSAAARDLVRDGRHQRRRRRCGSRAARATDA